MARARRTATLGVALSAWLGLAPVARADDAATDRPVTLDMVHADLRNLLRLFAEVGDVNIVYGEDVQGEVTLTLRQVPWDAALRAILATKGLQMQREGRIIRVAKAETFARERASAIEAQKSCLATAPLRTRVLRLSYAKASELAAIVEGTLSERGSVTVDARTNTLIIRDVDCD